MPLEEAEGYGSYCTIVNKRSVTHPTETLEMGKPSFQALEFCLSPKTKGNPTSPAWDFKEFKERKKKKSARLGLSSWADSLCPSLSLQWLGSSS